MSKSEAAVKLSESAQLFQALGDPIRLRVVSRLSSEGPASIAELTEGSKVSRQAVTKHLTMLTEAGLLRGRRRGRERIWELRTERIEAARRALEQVSKQWDAAVDRLKLHLGE